MFYCSFSVCFPSVGPKAERISTSIPDELKLSRAVAVRTEGRFGWYLNCLCLFFFWSRVCMWAQYKGHVLLKGIASGKWGGKETLLWCFIYQRNDFPQIKTCSILPAGLEQAARFLSWKLSACSNNAQRRNRGDVTSRRCGALLLFDRRFSLNRVFTVFVTSEWTDTIVVFELI